MEESKANIFQDKLDKSKRKGKTQKEKIKKGKREKRKYYVKPKQQDETCPFVKLKLEKLKDNEISSDSDDYLEGDSDDDPFGIIEEFLNGSTGCPYEDAFIAKYGHHSSY